METESESFRLLGETGVRHMGKMGSLIVINQLSLHLKPILPYVLAQDLIVLCESADKDDRGDIFSEVPLWPLASLPSDVHHAQLRLAHPEVARVDGPRRVTELEYVLGGRARQARRECRESTARCPPDLDRMVPRATSSLRGPS